ncbi:MAG: polyprenyl synthetase family protein [Thiobacillus sp.]|nr:polyprenyl synthetase family protein [Thiobacillus sp.]
MTDFATWTRAVQTRTEAALAHALPSAELAPERLHEAMRYVSLGGGKRVRPMLALAAAEAVGLSAGCDHGLPPLSPALSLEGASGTRSAFGALSLTEAAACAVELIHVYSLTHDDLPCMDDDDLRRGKPTCHVQYDEATALLVGDALQSQAFEILAEAGATAEMVALLARAAGSRGMCGGQAVDLASTGKHLDLAELEFMHIHKTGALIRAAVLLGGLSGGQLDDVQRAALEHYAKCVGLAFQVMDDVLDAEADTATLGKTAGKDAAQGKATYLTLMDVREARAYARELIDDALASIAPFGELGRRLAEIARFIVERQY